MEILGMAENGQPGLGFGIIATIIFAVIRLLSWLFGH